MPALVAALLVLVLATPIAIYSRNGEQNQLMVENAKSLAGAIQAAWVTAASTLDLAGTTAQSNECPVMSGILSPHIDGLGNRTASFQSSSAVTETQGAGDASVSNGVFSYAESVKADRACLACHNSQSNVRSFAVGERVGALVVTMPTAEYDRMTVGNVVYDLSFSAFLAVVCIFAVWLPLRRYITRPIERLEDAVDVIAQGDYELHVLPDKIEAYGEILSLVDQFNKMVDSVRDAYGTVEHEVCVRTNELQRANESLRYHQAEIEALNERLVTESNYKSEFLALVSHEFKTPLTAIMANMELLEHANDSAKRAELTASIDRSSAILLAMINQVLDAARIDAGKAQLNLEAVDMSDLVNTVDAFAIPIASRNSALYHSIESDIPIISVDGDKVLKIMTNLVSNAIKFSDVGGEVLLEVSYDLRSEQLFIAVSDEGVGIDEAEADMLFERFYQNDRTASRVHGGTGLGLSIVKEFACMHGGRACAEPLAKGSRFIVELPASPWERVHRDDDSRS